MARLRGAFRDAMLGLVAALALAGSAHGAAGDLDPTFSPGGTLTTPIPGAPQAAAWALVELPDGTLLVAGTAGSAGSFGVVLVRYLPGGALDASFGSGGIVAVDLGGSVAHGPVALARRADGRLVVAASLLAAGAGDFAVTQLDAAGAPDPSFGSGGRRVVDAGGDDRVAALALDGAGRVVVVGRGGAAPGGFAVVRLGAGGAPDAAFGGDGVVITDASGAGRTSAAHDVALQADGRIVVAGEARNATDLDIALVRYDDDGTLDDTFGDDGVVVTALGTEPFSTNDDVARAIVVQPDGRIVAAGGRHELGFFRIVLARYDASGTPDPAFGTGGVAFAGDGLGEGLVAADVVREPGGRFVTTGHYVSNQILGVGFPAVVRFASDGALDLTFGEGGVSLFGRPGHLFAIDQMYALLRDAHGRIVTVGQAHDFPPSNPSFFAIARLDGGGACGGGPLAGCRVSTRPQRSTLALRDAAGDGDVLRWQWRSGEATTRADFGNPLTGDELTLCVFDGSGASVLSAAARTGDCGGRPCWRSRPQGFLYRDGERAPDGIASVQLAPGVDGRAAIGLVARGPLLRLPALPAALPLTVQLRSASGACWEAVYEASGVMHDGSTRFAARAAR